MVRPPLRSTLFPYTTLFRSSRVYDLPHQIFGRDAPRSHDEAFAVQTAHELRRDAIGPGTDLAHAHGPPLRDHGIGHVGHEPPCGQLGGIGTRLFEPRGLERGYR